MNLTETWRSGFVRRWHSNPDLAATGQTNAHHQWGCAVLAMHLFPEDHDLLRAAILHDVAEVNLGDVSGLAKRQTPALKAALDKAEADNASRLGIEYTTSERLKFVDMLDAYLWAKHHRPDILDGQGWPDQLRKMTALATALGVLEKFRAIIEGTKND